MKKTTLVKTMLLLCALVVGSSSVWADNYTLQLSSEKKFYDSGLTDGYVEWSITNNDASIGSWSNSNSYNGQQFGTSSTTGNIVLSTSDINGTITKVEVTSQTGKNGGATVAVSVGGTSWGSNNMRVATGTGQTPGTLEFTHDGNGNGTVQITLTQTKKVAMYLNKIVITYTATKVATPKFSLAEGVYYGTQSVTINTLQNDVDFYYTTDGTDPTTSSTHYTEPVSISADATLKAIGVKDGLTNSEIASVPYAILTSYPAVTPKNYNTNYFVKVTDVNDLESGDAILMVNEAGGKVMTNQGSTYRNAADVTFSSEGVITSTPAKTEKIILVKTGNRYFFSTGAGYLYAASPTQNHLKSAEEATAGANGDGISVLNNSNATTPVFIVSGGNITAIGGNATTVNGRYGIHIYGDSKITGGTINATGGDATGYPGGAGFSSYNIYLAGCSVVAIGGDGTYSSGVLGTINFTTGSAKGCADGTSWNITYTTGEYPNNQYFKYE